MRTLLLIGVGAGDPGYVTAQAVEAMNRVDVFFVLDKGPAADDLAQARRGLLARFVPGDHRVVTVVDPPRDRAAEDYGGAVRDWHAERAAALDAAMTAELAQGQVGGLLVWGDPSLYDSTIRVAQAIPDVAFEVVPGVSSLHALTARHRITLNRIGAPVLVTTGRLLAQGWPAGVDDVAVMLDGDLACRAYVGDGLEIFWGAYLGTPDEVLVAGPLADVIAEIEALRRAKRAAKGWVMDVYLLRRRR